MMGKVPARNRSSVPLPTAVGRQYLNFSQATCLRGKGFDQERTGTATVSDHRS